MELAELAIMATEENKKRPFIRFKKTHYFAVVVLLLITIILILSLILALFSRSCGTSEISSAKNSNTSVTIEQDNVTLPLRLPPDLQNFVIERNAWRGKAPTSTKPLHHPIRWVVISHTVTPLCHTFRTCVRRVQSVQNYHTNGINKMSDIRYNFLVGGDGNVYVGRGWDVAYSDHDSSIEITFIGNYIFDQLTTNMTDVTKKLLDYGVKSGKLSEEYKLVGHNQTAATQSPGRNVFREIKTWPHFVPGKFSVLS